VPRQLSDYSEKFKKSATEIAKSNSTDSVKERENEEVNAIGSSKSNNDSPTTSSNKSASNQVYNGSEKLEKANAISAVLSKRIIKQRGGAFDILESEVTNFLKGRLEEILGSSQSKSTSLSDAEVQVLKLLAQRFMEKDKAPQPQRPAAVPMPSDGQRLRKR
jgi:hypothetical protein